MIGVGGLMLRGSCGASIAVDGIEELKAPKFLRVAA
eukprot:CAMPEP_0184303388 /NCGR_PEP_ID=MMETSP1049-20130417/13148_1 /TAXON_ID=77928 /ORGANISM="Proteomonas sulcata, Strain CCMP704" /LENGTH=35 /DNA_ID= /DNA_START= /DNA_END= /DNA_ORIENTATION=